MPVDPADLLDGPRRLERLPERSPGNLVRDDVEQDLGRRVGVVAGPVSERPALISRAGDGRRAVLSVDREDLNLVVWA